MDPLFVNCVMKISYSSLECGHLAWRILCHTSFPLGWNMGIWKVISRKIRREIVCTWYGVCCSRSHGITTNVSHYRKMLGIANGLAYLHNFKPGIFLEHLCPVCKILVSFYSQLTMHHANVEDNFREWRRSSTNLCIFKYDVWTAGILSVLGHSSSWDGELPLRWCPCQSIWWGLRLCNGMLRGKWLNAPTHLLTT